MFPAVNLEAVKTPERTTAAAFPRYAAGEVLADSASLRWKGLFVRRYRSPRVADRFLVPATPEPLVSCGVAGLAEFLERDIGGAWLTRQIGPGHIFVTRSKIPYEVRFSSRPGEELEIIQVHIAVDQFLAALEAAYPGKTDQVEVLDFFGRDEALAHLCFVCAEMLSARTPGKSKRVAGRGEIYPRHCGKAALPRRAADCSASQSRRLCERTSRGRDSGREVSRASGTESVPFFSRVQGEHGHVAIAVRGAGEDHARATAHPRNLTQPDRDRAGSWLHEPKFFLEGFSARDRCDTDGIPQQPLKTTGGLDSFSARTDKTEQDRTRRNKHDVAYCCHA